MRRKRLLGASAAVFITAAGIGLPVSGVMSSNAAPVPIYQNTSYSFAERAADLVARMTLPQKAAQGNSSQSPAIPSLGVATYGWWNESLHGVARYTTSNSANANTTDNDTSYPDDNSMGSTWDPNLIYNVGVAIGQEARDTSPNNMYDLDFYAPTINLARDPRWGRNDETWSEDPLLDAQLVDQYVDGMQGENQSGTLLPSGDGYYQAINTLKHYAAYNSENNRTNGNDPEDQRTVLEYDTLPFREIVQQAHPGSVMTSYPEVNGVPSPASYYLMDTLLRQTFGFTGYVTGDCDTTFEITSGHNWQPLDWSRPINVLERSGFAQAAGNDLTCDEGFKDSNNYGTSLGTDTLQGIVTEEDLGFAGGTSSAINNVDTYNEQDLDVSDARLFTARMELGEFDNSANVPYVQAAQARLAAVGVTGPYDTNSGATSLAFSNNNNAVEETTTRLALARQAGDEAMVLLKNSPAQGATNNALPLRVPATGTYNIAVVGYPAHPGTCIGTTNVTCTANIAGMYLGDYASNQTATGQAHETDVYTGLKNAIQAINPNANVTFINGYKNSSAGVTTIGTLTSVDATNTTNNASGTLCTGTGSTNDPASVCNLLAPPAGGWNAVIVMAATDQSTGTEGVDRTAITLPGAQTTLIQDVSNLTSAMSPAPPEIVYMETLGPIDVTGFDDPTPYDSTDTQVATNPAAVLWSGYNSQTQGLSFADVLLGAYNPSGHLSSTWYHDVSDLPPIDDYDIRPNGPDAAVGATNTPGRTYEYYSGPTSYPFGYGLSYTTYTDSNELVGDTTASVGATNTTQNSPLAVNANDTVQVQVTAKNTGSVAGNDVVQLYASQPNAPASLQRPIERLEGFQMVFLPAGGSQTVTFNVKMPSLAYFNTSTQTWQVDDGLYEFTVGASSAAQDVQTAGYINVSGLETPVVNVVSAKPSMPGDQARDIQQRIFYPIGTTVNPDLTVSMSNDQLYGNIEYGASQPFPAGMTFAYSSDNPSVAAVSQGGTISTVANGVATITATATYQGVSKSTTFVVRVLSYLSGITVNGSPLAGFEPDTYNYDMTLLPGASVPTVAATDPDAGATVTVTQAAGVPGTATVTDLGSDGITFTYTINFAYGAQGQTFNSNLSALGSQWTVVRPDPTHYALTANPGALTLTPENGDIETGASVGATNLAHNIVVQAELGNWTITTKAIFSTIPNGGPNTTSSGLGQQAGIIAYQNDNNYLEFGWVASGTRTSATPELAVIHQDSLGYVTGSGSVPPAPGDNATVLKTVATSTIPALASGTNIPLWLRMTKQGPYFTEYYSTDGVNWTQFYESGDSVQDVKVGMYAYNNNSISTNGLTVQFPFFDTTNAFTAISFTGSAQNGYYNQNPTVTLFPSDPGGPGIMSTSYSIDGGAWQTYTGPFKVTGDGFHMLRYYSTDNNGDEEAIEYFNLAIDTTPPVTTATVSPTPVNGATNGPATVTLHATDSFSGVANSYYSIDGSGYQIYTGPFTITAGGTHVVHFYSVDVAGNMESPETLNIQVNPQATTAPTGTVPSTLSVSVSNVTPSFGNFVAGVANTYTATVGATVTSSAASSTLTAADNCTPTATCFPGHLVNTSASGGPYEMPQGLEVDATSPNPAASGGGSYMNLANINPATILSYSAPVANDSVTVGFEQPVAATDPLRTGNYTKTITISLTTSTP